MVTKMKYEEAIKRLREICDKLRDERTTLEETAQLYKEGKKLVGECQKSLDEISAEIGEESSDE